MSFLIHQVDSLANKPRAVPRPTDEPHGSIKRPALARRNPFLPYEPELFVADVSGTHVALLNKFPVVPQHMLIVTRHFEPQHARLTPIDLQALARCLTRFRSFGFYNCGTTAGASQPHRHLQLIPLPLDDSGRELPIDTVLSRTNARIGEVANCAELSFDHGCVAIEELRQGSTSFVSNANATDTGVPIMELSDDDESVGTLADDLAAKWRTAYDSLLASRGWTDVSESTPHNLLFTSRWVLLVPRIAECYLDISLNAMAYAGTLLVKSDAECERLLAAGPLRALVATAGVNQRTGDGFAVGGC